MERWSGKVALVTGASVGIGAAVAEEFVKNGLKVVGLARRSEKVDELKNKLKGTSGELYSFKGDVSNKENVEDLFKFIEEKFGAIHVLVNNAGIANGGSIIDNSIEQMDEVIDINVKGLVHVTQKTLRLMKKTAVNDGHIININSVVGHTVPNTPIPMFNVYPASKYAVTAFTEVLRQDLANLKLQTKVTSLSPGRVGTEFGKPTADRPVNIPKELLERFKDMPKLSAHDVASAVIYVLQTPPNVVIQELIMSPLGSLH